MNPPELNDVYNYELLQNLANDNKQIVLMGGFNINMLRHDKNKDSTTFLDSMCSEFLLPYIKAPSRITSRFRTVIDDIIYQYIISYHYALFIITKIIQLKKVIKKPTNITLTLLIKMLLNKTLKILIGMKS